MWLAHIKCSKMLAVLIVINELLTEKVARAQQASLLLLEVLRALFSQSPPIQNYTRLKCNRLYTHHKRTHIFTKIRII